MNPHKQLTQLNSFLYEKLLRDGAIILHNVLTLQELSALDRESQMMLWRWSEGLIDDADYWTCPGINHNEVLYRIHRFETKWNETVCFLQQPAIQTILTRLFGCPSRPTAIALCVKLPMVGAPVPWHRDPIKADPGTIFNLSIYLDDSSCTNGCLEFVPGSHLAPHSSLLEEPIGLVPMTAMRGDIVIHDVNVIHGSRSNFSKQLRRALVVEFQRDNEMP